MQRLTRRELIYAGAVGAGAAAAGVGIILLVKGRPSVKPRAPAAEFLRVDPRGTGFVGAASGEPFTAWGFNWGGPGEYGDLAAVRQRFAQMRALGANTVRLHLQFGDVMESPTRASPTALSQLAAILEIAERERVYLDISGNEVWIPAQAPSWYGRLRESDRWDAQATYWSALAHVCATSPAVFCYDLLSEPVVGNGLAVGDWYTGKFGDFYFGQRISLDLAGRRPDDVARAWLAQLTAAVRAEDRRHLITLGLLPDMHVSGFDAAAVAPMLDFISVHVYPKTGHAPESIALVKQLAALGKPVLIEETYLLLGDVPTLESFIDGTQPYAAGWLGFYFPDLLAEQRGIRSELARQWIGVFRKYGPLLSHTPGGQAPAR